MDQNKVKEAFADETFVKELLGLEKPEDVQKALKAKGIEASIADIMGLRDMLMKTANGGEMSLEEMDTAAGGLSESLLQALQGSNISVNYTAEYWLKGLPGATVTPAW